MEKQTKITYWLIAGAVTSSVLHNALYGLLGIEEPVFFLLTLLLFLGFIVSIVYNIFTYVKKGEPKDLWKLGWLGLLGLLGVLPGFKKGLFGFYGFFAFFGLRK